MYKHTIHTTTCQSISSHSIFLHINKIIIIYLININILEISCCYTEIDCKFWQFLPLALLKNVETLKQSLISTKFYFI